MPASCCEEDRALVDAWYVSATTENRAIKTVDVPERLLDDLYQFSSRATPGQAYLTTLRFCSCPAYQKNMTRPCKHMVRLAMGLGYYSVRYHTNCFIAPNRFDGSPDPNRATFYR